MKLITLNTWCGKIYEPLEKFIKEQAKDTDVFCFQEVRNGPYTNQPEEEKEVMDLFNKLEMMLPDFKGYFTDYDIKNPRGVGIATFIRNTLEIIEMNSSEILSAEEVCNVRIGKDRISYPRVIQITTLDNPKISIYNFHGVAGGLSRKRDTPERDLQTKRLLDILNKDINTKILVGDFNLSPDTNAIYAIEQQMRNLIKESTYKTTRNNFYNMKELLPFADYIFVSKDIKVKDFKVLPDEVSDHLALSIEI